MIKHLVIILFFFIATALSLIIDDFGKISTNFVIPTLFIILALSKNQHFRYLFFNNYLKYFFIVLIISLLSSFYAESLSHAIETNKRFFICSIGSLILFAYAIQSKTNLNTCYLALFISSLFFLIYVFQHINFSEFTLTVPEYLSNERGLYDRNTIGYYSFICIFSISMFEHSLKYKKLLYIFKLIIFSYIVIVIFSSGSRGGFITILLYIYAMMFIGYKRNNILKIAVYSIPLIIILNIWFLSNIWLSSVMFDRFNDQYLDAPRILHLIEGTKVAISNPILGVGAGNYAIYSFKNITGGGGFSHNTVIELIANYGFITAFIFTIFFYNNIKTLIHIYKSTKSLISLHLIISLFSLIVYSNFYVLYLTLEFTSVAFLICAHIYHLQLQNKREKNITDSLSRVSPL